MFGLFLIHPTGNNQAASCEEHDEGSVLSVLSWSSATLSCYFCRLLGLWILHRGLFAEQCQWSRLDKGHRQYLSLSSVSHFITCTCFPLYLLSRDNISAFLHTVWLEPQPFFSSKSLIVFLNNFLEEKKELCEVYYHGLNTKSTPKYATNCTMEVLKWSNVGRIYWYRKFWPLIFHEILHGTVILTLLIDRDNIAPFIFGKIETKNFRIELILVACFKMDLVFNLIIIDNKGTYKKYNSFGFRSIISHLR